MKSRDGNSPVVDFLDRLIGDAPSVRRAGRQERLRLELARGMRNAREALGLTQVQVASALGVSQSWVSKLESPNYDHKLESLLAYTDAIGAELNVLLEAAGTRFQVWGSVLTSEPPGDFLWYTYGDWDTEGVSLPVEFHSYGERTEEWKTIYQKIEPEQSTSRESCQVN